MVIEESNDPFIGNSYFLYTILNLISASCTQLPKNSAPSFNNGVDLDQLASDEAS